MGCGFGVLTALADAYKMTIVAFLTKTNTATNKETQAFVGDCIGMVRFGAGDDPIDKTMMDGLLGTIHNNISS